MALADMPSASGSSRYFRRLAALALTMLLPSLGTSIANVALPSLEAAFAAPINQVQWVVLSYLLAVTTLIVGVGRLGDLMGRRRLLLAGIAIFALASGGAALGRASASAILGIAYWSEGKLKAARHAWTEGKRGLQRVGHLSDSLGVSIALGDISLAQGHLREAVQVHEQGLELATAQGSHVLRGTADMHVGLSELHRERNDLVAAHHHLLKSQELGESAGLPQYPHRWRVAMAHLKRDEGDLEGAATLLDEAERVYASDFFPNVRPVAAMRARVCIAHGAIDASRRRGPIGSRCR